ncbi:MAG TPA: ABC transporter permease [Thermomicrobiales bacterium]|nr:ABC transporter permease [Thermomicrobiales bacterium]
MAEQSTEIPRASTLEGAFAEVRARQSPARRALRMLRKNRLGVIGMVILLVVALAAVFAPIIAPYDVNQPGQLTKRLHCPAFTSCPRYGTDQTIDGSTEHVLGTDQLGRDILTRIIYGARVSLIVGLTAVLIGAGFGLALGLFSGYYGGWLDSLLMRIGDIFLAFPYLLLAIAVVAVLGGGLMNVIIVLAIAIWVPFARITRGSVLSAKTQEYIVAARAIGVHDSSLLVKHLLPNVVTPIIVYGTFAVAATIIAEAGLSFLGLGVGGTRPTWGNMLADGRNYIATAWWLATIPGVAIMLTVLSINLIGDWLRDVLDPRLRNIE